MAALRYPELPEPEGRIVYEARDYEQAWISSQDAYSEDQLRKYAEPLLRRINELELAVSRMYP
jgi:hypothetical protein